MRATRKRVQRSLGPSNDAPDEVQIEMRAAELVAVFESREPVESIKLYLTDCELTGWLSATPEPDDYVPGMWAAGALAAWIVEHEHRGFPWDEDGEPGDPDPNTGSEPMIVVGIDSDDHGTAVQINGLCEAPPLLTPDEADTLADHLRAAAALARRTRPEDAAWRGHLPIAGAQAPERPDVQTAATRWTKLVDCPRCGSKRLEANDDGEPLEHFRPDGQVCGDQEPTCAL